MVQSRNFVQLEQWGVGLSSILLRPLEDDRITIQHDAMNNPC